MSTIPANPKSVGRPHREDDRVTLSTLLPPDLKRKFKILSVTDGETLSDWFEKRGQIKLDGVTQDCLHRTKREWVFQNLQVSREFNARIQSAADAHGVSVASVVYSLLLLLLEVPPAGTMHE